MNTLRAFICRKAGKKSSASVVNVYNSFTLFKYKNTYSYVITLSSFALFLMLIKNLNKV